MPDKQREPRRFIVGDWITDKLSARSTTITAVTKLGYEGYYCGSLIFIKGCNAEKY